MSSGSSGQPHWRSLEQLSDTVEFREMMEREFPSLLPAEMETSSRRTFMKLMAASVAMAGMTACRWPQETILPFAKRPQGRIPGVPQQFATAWEIAGGARGLLVTSLDGRPIKVEGNPLHPLNAGTTDAMTQALILQLYDPDRSRRPLRAVRGQLENASWDRFAAEIRERHAARGGDSSGLALLSESSSSPSFAAQRDRILADIKGVRWHEYEAISVDNERVGATAAFGRPLRARLDLRAARLVVSLDDDLLGTHVESLRHAREFASHRDADDGEMTRLHVIESALTVTGAMADHRYPESSAGVAIVAAQLAAELLGPHSGLPHGLAEAFARSEGRLSAPYVRDLAAELEEHRGSSVVTAGIGQPPEVHALVHVINERLGNVGRTVTYTVERTPRRSTHTESIEALVADIRGGKVETLVIIGGNPVFDAPSDLDFAEALQQVGLTAHLSEYVDETSIACTWHLPRAHVFETWGDARAHDGTISVAQPLIEPLFEGRSPIELLALLLAGGPSNGYEIVRATARGYMKSGGFESRWRRALHDGIVSGSSFAAVSARVDFDEVSRLLGDWRPADPPTDRTGLELVFRQDPKLYDGRFANNGWLQELPEPATKLAWDNAALVSKKTADALGVESHELVTLDLDGRTLEAPLFAVPGHPDGSVTLWLGQGRRAAGRVGDGVGFDAYRLRTTSTMHRASGLKVRPTGRSYTLATTQDHFAIDILGLNESSRRVPELVREANLEEYKAHPDFAEHRVHTPELHELWKPHEYNGYKWGMSIDLSTCIGCSACVIACQAENNIPVVGKEEVIRGREMHWIRVDRYFKGDADAPQVVFQPVTCHHCENAPCEQVCPVAATVHSEEGLNQMVYNRCIGTRYCSNNCPYKVRRFNFFNNQKDETELEALRYNPEVTVRSRGVMEKCTYCVQRIEAARSLANQEDRPIGDGEVTPACAQACPTRAIVFGDLNDPQSRVARLHGHQRSYAMLAELKVKPRTRYLAKIRNPRSGTADGGASQEGHA